MLLTFQDFQTAVEKGKQLTFIRDAIENHRNSDQFKIAEIADEYDAQRNTTINDMVRKIYSLTGKAVEDFTASNNRIASNFFRRLITQRCTYSLGNGLTFDTDGVKEKLGDKFDTDLFQIAYNALKHRVCFGFWNVDRLHNFPLTEFVPLFDETDGALRAGIRFWSLDWKQKPVYAVLYEEDGYTKYKSKGKNGLAMEELEPKRAYRQTIAHTDAGGDEVIGEENYGSLPIVPLWGNKAHQSVLVGMRAAIDSYDIIQSGFANDMTDCAEVYWLIGNAMGMEDEDVQKFMDRLRLTHVAVADTDNSSITPYTQEPPYNAREAYLNRIEYSLYRDFGALNTKDISAGNVTATQIKAAYQAQDEEADAFEYQVIDFVQHILALQNIQAVPTFKRNRIANQAEEVNMIIAASSYLDTQTVLEKLPITTPDEVPEIMARLDAEGSERLEAPSDGQNNPIDSEEQAGV